MQLSMHVNDTGLAEAVKTYTERRLRFALARFGAKVGHVVIRITAHGRTVTRCWISAEVLPFGEVTAEESSADLFAAIDSAAGRVGRLFGRELERIRDARTRRESVRLAA